LIIYITPDLFYQLHVIGLHVYMASYDTISADLSNSDTPYLLDSLLLRTSALYFAVMTALGDRFVSRTSSPSGLTVEWNGQTILETSI